SLFSDQLDENTPARSSSLHHQFLTMKLEEAMDSGASATGKTTQAAKALHQIAESIHKRSLVIIFSDMMESGNEQTEELFSALQHLKYNKHEVILFHVTDKKREMEFTFENRPYEFIDVETGESVKVHSSEVKQLYLEKMRKAYHDLKLRCAQ